MDKFVKKNIIDKKREEELRAHKDEFADFEGSKSELYFLKFTHMLARNRKNVFIGLGFTFVLLAVVIGYFEYQDYRFQKETVLLEDIIAKHKKGKANTDLQIADLETFLNEQSSGNMDLRVWKDLSRLYAEKSDWAKAAEYLEKAGKKIDTPKEMKAYYFYLAGNYRDKQPDLKKALENFKVASTLLETNNETKSFKAWSFYQTGRLQLANGDKPGAKLSLEKVLKIDATESDNLEDVKLLTTYLLLKLGKP
jgi:tetratricopeptide (TPR) repeat protein